MAPLLSLQSLLHVSSLEHGNSQQKKKFRNNIHEHRSGTEQKKVKDKNVNLLIEGKAIKQRKSECLSDAEADDLVSLARMFSEEGNFQGTCLHVDEEQLAEKEKDKTIYEEQNEDDDCTVEPVEKEAIAHATLPHNSATVLVDKVLSSENSAPVLSPLERLQQSHVFPLEDYHKEDPMLSASVSGIIESGLLVGDLDKATQANLIDINSGGELYFVFFRSDAYFDGQVERACVLKFAPSRMGTQGEALAYEIAMDLGVPSPPARIIREGSEIWNVFKIGAGNLCEMDLEESADGSIESGDIIGVPTIATSPNALLRCLKNSKCALLIELVHGPPLARASEEFLKHQYSLQVASSMGSLFALDMILGNPDRLTVKAFGWRGNKNNLRWDCSALRVVGIDHTLARRPPRMLKCTPQAVGKVTSAIGQLKAGDNSEAAEETKNNLKAKEGDKIVEDALFSVFGDLSLSEEDRLAVASHFRQGLRDTFSRSELESSPSVLSRLKATEAFLSNNLNVFFASLRSVVGVSDDCDFNSTRDLRNLQKQAAEDEDVRSVFRESQKALSLVIASHVQKSVEETSVAPGVRSFLQSSPDTTAVDCYELRTRLRHIIPRFEAFVHAMDAITSSNSTS